jgi:hypothetical protein
VQLRNSLQIAYPFGMLGSFEFSIPAKEIDFFAKKLGKPNSLQAGPEPRSSVLGSSACSLPELW